MDAIGESINRKFELDMTESHINEIDTIFKEFMREYHFPISLPPNEPRLKRKYLKKALSTFSADQLKKYRLKKTERKQKELERREEKDKKHKQHIKKMYGHLELNEDQIDVFAQILKRGTMEGMSPIQKQELLLKTLNDELTSNQVDQVKQIFKSENDKFKEYRNNRDNRNIARVKREYEYLDLTDKQAISISRLHNPANSEQQKSKILREYKRYPFKLNPDLKIILTDGQYEEYKSNQLEKRTKELDKRIEKDKNRQEEYEELIEWERFMVEKVMKKRCIILKEIIANATKEDLKIIENLKIIFSEKIDESIAKSKAKNEERNQILLPNQHKLTVYRTSLNFINPSALVLKDEIDLGENIFDSIKLNDSQVKSLDNIKLEIRDYNIRKLESKMKSYASLSVIGKKLKVEPYEDLYSLILLGPELEDNIKNKEMRQITIDDDGITPSS